MRKSMHLHLTTATIVMLLFMLTLVARAQPPTPPCWLYGTASQNGRPVQDNANVTAVIEGTNLSWTTKTVNGTYGWTKMGSASFCIPYDNLTSPNKDGGVDGDTIEFYIDGVKTNQTATFENLSLKRVDLSVTSTPKNGNGEKSPASNQYALYAALGIIAGVALTALWIRRRGDRTKISKAT